MAKLHVCDCASLDLGGNDGGFHSSNPRMNACVWLGYDLGVLWANSSDLGAQCGNAHLLPRAFVICRFVAMSTNGSMTYCPK
jgi:hypothetical protein